MPINVFVNPRVCDVIRRASDVGGLAIGHVPYYREHTQRLAVVFDNVLVSFDDQRARQTRTVTRCRFLGASGDVVAIVGHFSRR
jgi:hypothetical protein